MGNSWKTPAFWVGLIEAVLALLLPLVLDKDQTAAVLAVITAAFGFYTAYVTKHTLLAVGVGLAKSVLILMLAFHLNIPKDTMTAFIAAITIILGAFNHTQTSPADKHSFNPRVA